MLLLVCMWIIVFLYDFRVGKHFDEKFIWNWKEVFKASGVEARWHSYYRCFASPLGSISSKGCKKVNFELLSAMPLILLFIDDYKILVLLHHELASSLLHAQLLLEKCFY